MTTETKDTAQYHCSGSPLKWHGGKHYLAKKLIALMPPHLHYVEPYGGSLAVLLERDPNRNWLHPGNVDKVPSFEKGCSEVVNDMHGDLMNFWKVLQGPETFSAFQRTVEAVPFSEEMWETAGEFSQDEDIVRRAVGFFIRCRQSRAGTFKDFATLTRNRTRRKMNEQASAWLTVIDGLPGIHSRLKRVVILNHDALKVIQQQDGEKTLFYLDPPYLAETRASTGQYDHEMTEAEHMKLLDVLSTCEGKFLLSGYPSELYNAKAQECGWHHIDVELPNNAGGGKKKRRMIERVWMNFEPRSK
jgi:DNA adenine methylase